MLFLISSTDASSSIFLYFHSKGMVHHGNNVSLSQVAVEPIFNVVIETWRNALTQFYCDEELNKAGYASAPGGWQFYNFYWVRASYLRRVVRPIISRRRHYYEDWLGRIDENPFVFFDLDVTLHLDYVGSSSSNLLVEEEEEVHVPHYWSTCGDSWSMCLGEYEKGVALLPSSIHRCTLYEPSEKKNGPSTTRPAISSKEMGKCFSVCTSNDSFCPFNEKKGLAATNSINCSLVL